MGLDTDALVLNIQKALGARNLSVLHVPCGNGELSAALLKSGIAKTLHGVDADKENITNARRLCIDLPASFQVRDPVQMHRAWAQYDMVVALGMAEAASESLYVPTLCRYSNHARYVFVFDLPPRLDEEPLLAPLRERGFLRSTETVGDMRFYVRF